MATEKAVEIIDIYTHKVEKRLDRLGTYLAFIVIPLLLIIAILSTIGIQTNKFNKLISDKISQTKNINLKLYRLDFN